MDAKAEKSASYNSAKSMGNGGLKILDNVANSAITGDIAGIQVLSGDLTINTATKISNDTRAENLSTLVFPAGSWVCPCKDADISTTGVSIVVLG